MGILSNDPSLIMAQRILKNNVTSKPTTSEDVDAEKLAFCRRLVETSFALSEDLDDEEDEDFEEEDYYDEEELEEFEEYDDEAEEELYDNDEEEENIIEWKKLKKKEKKNKKNKKEYNKKQKKIKSDKKKNKKIKVEKTAEELEEEKKEKELKMRKKMEEKKKRERAEKEALRKESEIQLIELAGQKNYLEEKLTELNPRKKKHAQAIVDINIAIREIEEEMRRIEIMSGVKTPNLQQGSKIKRFFINMKNKVNTKIKKIKKGFKKNKEIIITAATIFVPAILGFAAKLMSKH